MTNIHNASTPVLFAWAFFVSLVLMPSDCKSAEVLIYYANENAPEGKEAENYQTIVSWLRSSNDSHHLRTADQLERDSKIFRAAVDVETTEISLELPRTPSELQGIIFTNRLARDGRCLVWKEGWPQFRQMPFAVESDENFILAANPLSQVKTLANALAFAANEFDPKNHEFVLVTKSHGSVGKAITPRLVVRADETSKDELLRVASNQNPSTEMPSWAGKLGISKSDYLTILANAHQDHGMNFSLVFMESCNAISQEIQSDHLPKNVTNLMVIKGHANYINIIWADELQGLSKTDRLSETLLRNRNSKFVVLGSKDFANQLGENPHAQKLPLGIYLVPLILWIAWVSIKTRTKLRQRAI